MTLPGPATTLSAVRVPLLLLCFCASACALSERFQDGPLVSAAGSGSPSVDVDADAAMPPAVDDEDGDGLCNETEAEIGSDPSEVDTDHDGFSDFVEFMAAFDPKSVESPGLDQVGVLIAKHGATLDFETRATVDGMGEGYTGVLTAYPSFNVDGFTVESYLVNGRALAASPPDNARDVEPERARFGTIVGHTRLSFRLRFDYKKGSQDATCADAFSFSYGVKDDLGRREGTRDYLLVVVPDGSAGLDARSFCVPASCF